MSFRQIDRQLANGATLAIQKGQRLDLDAPADAAPLPVVRAKIVLVDGREIVTQSGDLYSVLVEADATLSMEHAQ